MRKIVYVAATAALLALTGCSTTSFTSASQDGPPTAAADSTFDPTPEDWTPTPDPLLSPDPAPVATPTPTPTHAQPVLTITFFGTNATFSWTDGSGMHQVQQSGPYEVKMPYHNGMLLNANSVTLAKDAGCKATITNDLGNVIPVVDNTLAGQSLAACTKVLN